MISSTLACKLSDITQGKADENSFGNRILGFLMTGDGLRDIL